MTKVRYVGMSDPRAELEKFREARLHALRLMQKHRPFGEDYLVLLAIADAILRAGHHFIPTDPHLFAAPPGRSFGAGKPGE